MKKLLIVFSCILMMFAIVACNQAGPDVKPDAFEEANQAIPSSNVDMTTAKVVTEDEEAVGAFTSDFGKAKTQVMSGIVGQVIEASGSEEGIDWMGIINSVLGNGASKALDEGSADSDSDPTVKVDIDSMAGVLSLTCEGLTFKDSATDENGRPVMHTLATSVTATLSRKTISITASGTLDGEVFAISGTVTLNTYAKNEEEQIVYDFGDSAVLAKIKGIVSDCSLAGSKDITIILDDIQADLGVTVKNVAKVPVGVSLKGSIVLSLAMDEKNELNSVLVNVNSLTAKVDAGALGNASASIKDLKFELIIAGLSTSLSISEVSLFGTLLPNNDNIRLKATMKGFELDSNGVIAIDSIEATVLGYENISAAAKVEGFRADTSTDEVFLSFKFAAAASFEKQTIGIRGEWGNSESDGPITIAVLNREPVKPDSLIALIVGTVTPSPDVDGTV